MNFNQNQAILGLLAFLIYAAVMAAILASLWYQYKFYRDYPMQSDSTIYLTKFHFVVFIISCVVIGSTILAMLLGMAFVAPQFMGRNLNRMMYRSMNYF